MIKIYIMLLIVYGTLTGAVYFMADGTRSIGFTNICGEHKYFCTRKVKNE